MTSSEQLLTFGLAAVATFLVVKYAYKQNTHNPAMASPSGTGVIGVSPVLNPAAPKTPGDFVRYDRSLPINVDSSPKLTFGDFTRLDHDLTPTETPALDLNGEDPRNGAWG